MKRFNLFILIALVALVALAATAFAAGNLPWTKNKTLLQNLTGIAPVKGQSGCTTKAITKGTFGSYTTVTGFTGYEGEVVTATGAAEPVKWELDGTQVATGSSFKFTNSGGSTYARAVQRVYSAPSRTLTGCVRRQ